jgi:hypothetical protein
LEIVLKRQTGFLWFSHVRGAMFEKHSVKLGGFHPYVRNVYGARESLTVILWAYPNLKAYRIVSCFVATFGIGFGRGLRADALA